MQLLPIAEAEDREAQKHFSLMLLRIQSLEN